jgi:alkylation response protein AidB-like acyl-CoA dehydrogenase
MNRLFEASYSCATPGTSRTFTTIGAQVTSDILETTATPTRAELVARAVALQPLLRAHASDSESNRRLDDAVIAGLSDAGLFRLLKPSRFGGYATGVRTVVEITEALGVADGSAAWVVGLGASAGWMIGLSSPRVQEEVLGSDPDVRLAGSAHPAPARQVDGGLVVSGRWPYASGSHHAAWAGISAAVIDDAGGVVDVYMCLVPSSEMRLDDTWHVAGMRGTGSNTWVADELFVPEHRLMSMSAIGDLGAQESPLPFAPLATLMLVGPLLGLGQATLSVVSADASKKTMHHTVFARQSDSVGVQVQVAEAALALQTARLHAYQAADTLDEAVAGARTLTYDDRAQIRAASGYAAQQVLTAIQELVNVHGAASFAETSPVQRYWRDANTAARHAGLNAVVGYEVLGKVLLGVDERISPMV